jgi:hypothetical protein
MGIQDNCLFFNKSAVVIIRLCCRFASEARIPRQAIPPFFLEMAELAGA